MTHNNLAPIALFTYNRPEHTRQCLESLMANPEAKNSVLHIFSDGPKAGANKEDLDKINRVRQLALEKPWCGEVKLVIREQNLGLAKSIMTGVGEILAQYESIIVLEDDLILSEGFLKFMNSALTLYRDEEKVLHVSGFIYPIKSKALPDTFFLQNASCLGWGTWLRAWEKFNPDAKALLQTLSPAQIKKLNFTPGMNFLRMLKLAADGKISSWAVRWYASIVINEGLSLHPNKSFVNNIGFDGSGVHSGIFNPTWSPTLATNIEVQPIPLELNYKARRLVQKNYIKTWFLWKIEGLINILGLDKWVKKFIS